MSKPPSNQPVVSVIMPVYNGRTYLEDSISSLVDQNDGALEILTVDNGSTDGSRDLLEELSRKNPRIKLFDQPQRGIASARNSGLANASGNFVTFLDQDDMCPQGTVARQLSLLVAEPHAQAIYGLTLVTGTEHELAAPQSVPQQQLAMTMMLSAALFRRSIFEQIGLFDPSYRLADDLDFLLRIIEADLPVVLEKNLATVHRRHSAQATADLAATRSECTKALAASLRRRRLGGKASPLNHPLVSVLTR